MYAYLHIVIIFRIYFVFKIQNLISISCCAFHNYPPNKTHGCLLKETKHKQKVPPDGICGHTGPTVSLEMEGSSPN